MSKRIYLLFSVFFLTLLLAACGSQETDNVGSKVRDLDFTVVAPHEMQDEIRELVEARQAEPFQLTYSDGNFLYIVAGYGRQDTGGYSIAIEDLYLGENAILVSTQLIGPTKEDAVEEGESYPYIVIKIENMDKIVVFE